MIELQVKKRGKVVRICAMIPEDYPVTPFYNYCMEEHDGCFGRLMIDLSSASNITKRLGTDFYTFPWNDRNFELDPDDVQVLFLHSFYVHSQSDVGSKLASVEEKKLMRGLGKRMLCEAVHAFAEDLDSDMAYTYVIAEADGARVDIIDTLKQKYAHMNNEYLLWHLLVTYPSELQKQIKWMGPFDKADLVHESLLEFIAGAEANTFLVDYYKRIFGFSVWQKSVSTGCLIGANLEKILENCS